MVRFHYSQIRVKFEGEDGSGPGVNRGLFASLANELKSSNTTKHPMNKVDKETREGEEGGGKRGGGWGGGEVEGRGTGVKWRGGGGGRREVRGWGEARRG